MAAVFFSMEAVGPWPRYTFLVKEDPLDLRKAKAILEVRWSPQRVGTDGSLFAINMSFFNGFVKFML